MVAKLRTSRYEPGRRSAWLKIKIRREQEVVVVGYEPGKGARADLGSLILGVYDGGPAALRRRGGQRPDDRTIRQLKSELDEHRVDTPPVVDPPRIKGARVVGAAPRHARRVHRMDDRRLAAPGRVQGHRHRQGSAHRGPRARATDRGDGAKAEKEAKQPTGRPPGRPTSRRQAGRPSLDAQAPARSAPATEAVEGRRAVLRGSGDRTDPPQAATPDELAALEAMTKDGTWEIGGETIPLTNLDKVLFPESGFTKRDLIRYYVTIAPVMLPYLRDRPLNLWRWPDGVTGGTLLAEADPRWAPEWIARWDYPEAGLERVPHLCRRRPGGDDGLAGQPRDHRPAPVDVAHRRLPEADVRADRHRPRRRRRHWTRSSRWRGCTARRWSTWA